VVQRSGNDHRTVTPRHQPARTGVARPHRGDNATRRDGTSPAGRHALRRPARVALVAVAASCGPALRATRLDAVAALRD